MRSFRPCASLECRLSLARPLTSTLDALRTHVGVYLSGRGRQTTALFITFRTHTARRRLDEASIPSKSAPYLDRGPPPWAAGGQDWGDGGGLEWNSYHGKKSKE